MALPKPYFQDDLVTLYLGECRDILATLPDASVDAVVTDPPYGLTANKKGCSGVASVNLNSPYGRARIGTGNGPGGFMGMQWDGTGVAFDPATWEAVWRVLKPGGHLLACGGTRTFHRMTCAIEDAGFEIRDTLMWLYGSGFPKSLDVSKAIDKVQRRDYVLAAIDLGLEIPGNNLHDWTKAEHSPGDAWWEKFKAHLSEDDWQRIERKVIGQRTTGIGTGNGSVSFIQDRGNMDITAPATDAARQWAGWGTALKPAYEPIILARKPLAGTVAANVLTHGTGALNIDGCRIPTDDKLGGGDQLSKTKTKVDGWDRPWMRDEAAKAAHAERVNANVARAEALGRWPANVCLDEAAAALLDQMSGERKAGSPKSGREPKAAAFSGNLYGDAAANGQAFGGYRDTGGASRFFYVAKASRAERGDGNGHPTVKPLALMQWLVRLVTPPGGTVLDPFLGSGTTGIAAAREGFAFIGIEMNPEYVEIAVKRREQSVLPLLAGVTT